jgi:hypothetical protein
MADSIDDFLTGKTGSTAAPSTTSGQKDNIDEFLTGGGAAPATLTQPPQDSIRFDPARLAIIGQSVMRGLHAGVDVPAEALASGYDKLTNLLGYSTTQGPQTATADTAFKSAYDVNPANQGLGPATARFAGELLPTLPAAIATGGLASGATNIAGRALVGQTPNFLAAGAARALPVLAGGAAGGATAAAQSGQPIGEGAASGAALAGVAGLIGAGGRAAMNAVSGGGGGVSAADAALGDLAINKYKIPIDATDLTSNSLYRIAADQSSKLPFSGSAAQAAEKQAAWQGAILKEMGEPGAKSFTPDVLAQAKNRIGPAFDAVAARTSIDPASTNTMVGDLGQIMHEAESTPLPEGALKTLQRQVDDLVGIAAKGNGTISGDAYQAITRAKAPLDLAESATDPNIRHVAGKIRDALDDAFVRSAAPEDQAALLQARYQYRIMRTVQDLAAGSRDGNISPDAFMQKVLTSSRRFDSPTGGMAYTGGGNIGELARIGKLMRAAPQTGTADRAAINLLALGGTAGPALLNPVYAAGVPLALAANRAAGGYLRSAGLANRLIQSSLNPPVNVGGVPLSAGAYGATANALAANRLVP